MLAGCGRRSVAGCSRGGAGPDGELRPVRADRERQCGGRRVRLAPDRAHVPADSVGGAAGGRERDGRAQDQGEHAALL